MGISTIQSYQGAKIFEAIGLKTDFINRYFTDTVSRVGGIGIEEIAEDYTAFHTEAFDPLGLQVDMTLTVLENINIKVAEKNISIIHRQSICFSSPQDVVIMKCSSSIQRWLMRKARRSI